MFREILAQFTDKRCRKEQRGFLTNRFLWENVVDIDFETRKVYRSEGFPNGIFHPCALWARGLARWESSGRVAVAQLTSV